MTSPRDSSIDVASDGNGIVGIVDQGPVQKNMREPMVELANNGAEEMTITVELDISGDGTLYDNVGGSGSSVTFALAPGNSRFVDIEAVAEGIIGYGVSISSSSMDINTTGSVESVGGNANAFVRVHSVQGFLVNAGAQNNWTLDQAQAEDRDNDDDLDRVEYEIRDSDGALQASRTDPASGGQYDGADLTFDPDDPGYDVLKGETYALTVRAFDVDGHNDSETVEDTAPANDPTAIQFNNLQNFQADAAVDEWTIEQVQAQDNDNDNDLDRVEFVITDSSDMVRGTRTDAEIDVQEYHEQTLQLSPDDPGYTITAGETYTLTVTVYDADGNFVTETRETTA